MQTVLYHFKLFPSFVILQIQCVILQIQCVIADGYGKCIASFQIVSLLCYSTNPVCYSTNPVCYSTNPVCYSTNPMKNDALQTVLDHFKPFPCFVILQIQCVIADGYEIG